MIAGTLEVQMLANMARLASDMTKAKATVTGTMNDISRSVSQAKSLLASFGLGLGIVGFAHMVKSALEAQDSLAKLSQKINITVESLVGLNYAASLSGSSIEGVQKGIKTLGTQMFDASSGLIESQRNFKALRIEINDTTGGMKTTEDVMYDIADRFAAMENSTAKTALAVKLFGKAGLDMIPMLNMGREALQRMIEEGKLLSPVTAESAAQAEHFNDNMNTLSHTFTRIGTQLLNDIIPTLNEFVNIKIGERLREIKEEAQGAGERFNYLSEAAKAIIIFFGNVDFVLKGVGTEIGGITAQIELAAEAHISFLKWLSKPWDLTQYDIMLGKLRELKSVGEEMRKDAEQRRKEFDEWEKRILLLGKPRVTTGDTGIPTKPIGFKVDLNDLKTVTDTDAAYRGLLKTLKEKLAIDGELTEVQKLQNTLDAMSAKTRATITAAREKELMALAHEIDMREAQKKLYASIIDLLEKEASAMDTLNKAWSDYNRTLEKGLKDIQFETDILKKESVLNNAGLLLKEDEIRLTAKVNAERETAVALRELEIQYMAEYEKIGAEEILSMEERERRLNALTEAYERQQQAIKGAITEREQVRMVNELTRASVDEFKTLWGTVESTGKAVFVNLFNSGKDTFQKLGESIKASLIDLLYQLTVRKWIINIGASISGSFTAGAANAAGSSLFGGGGFSPTSLLNFGGGGGFSNVAMDVGNALGIGVGFNAAGIEALAGIPELGLIADAGTAAAGSALGGSALAGIGAAVPYIGLALGAAALLGGGGLFGGDKNPAERTSPYTAPFGASGGYPWEGNKWFSADMWPAQQAFQEQQALYEQNLIHNLQLTQAQQDLVSQALASTYSTRFSFGQEWTDVTQSGGFESVQAARLNAISSALGKSIEELTQVMQLSADQWDQMVAQAESALSSAESTLGKAARALPDALGISDLEKFQVSLATSEYVSPLDQLAAARNQYEDVLAKAQGGDLNAISAFPGAAQTLLGIGRNVFASGPAFQDLFKEVNSSLLEVLAQQRGVQDDIMREIPAAIMETSQNQIAEMKKGFTAMVTEVTRLRSDLSRLKSAA